MRSYRTHIFLLLAGTLISCHALASKIDTIYFQNGDRITAEVKSLENNHLKLSTDDAGTLNVEWNKVDSVKILNSMRILLDNGMILYGKLLPAGEAGKCYIWSSAEEPLMIALVRIVGLAPMEERFIDRIGGTLSSGFSYVKTSRVMQMNFDASVKYAANKNQIQLAYSGLFSKDPTTGNSQNQSGAATFIRLLPKKWFALSELTAESNSEMDLDIRTSLVLGAGNAMIRNDRSYLYAAAGFLTNREVSLGLEQFNLEGMMRAQYSIFIYDSPEVSLTLTGDLIPSLSNLGRVRSNIDSSMKWEIFNDFYLKWTFYFSYDSRPITQGSEKNDWAVTLIGLEYKL